MRSSLPSLAFYAADLAAGWATGCVCPSCRARGNPVLSRKHWVDGIRECRACRLLYRPSAISRGWLARLYYSRLYTDAGIATDTSIPASRAPLRERVQREGKDRSSLVRAAIAEHGVDPDAIGVFGCSWGYELIALEELGLSTFGIELSAPRRALAVERFGLSVFPDIAGASGRFARPVVLSSHALEHVANVEQVLDQLRTSLRPCLQIHVTPAVTDATGVRSKSIGREHVLGVTSRFWHRYAEARRLSLTLHDGSELPGAQADELVAVLK